VQAAGRFYRPELDVLRFSAFFCVFLVHGPRFSAQHGFFRWWNQIADTGVYGLSLFFFLSSYLITELLLREREKTGDIDRKAFYVRRVLRIWPLYYLGVGLGIVVSWWRPEVRMNHREILYLLTFLGYLDTIGYHGNPAGVLWSISVEELFYVLWPQVAKRGERALLVLSLLFLPIALGTAALVRETWYNPLIQFVFFATGALTALFLHGRAWSIPNLMRMMLAVSGASCWLLLQWLPPWPRAVAVPLNYVFAALGCLLLLLSVLGLSRHLIPKTLIYLGKISYGLYVFHLFFYRFAGKMVLRFLGNNPEFMRVLVIYSLTLGGTIAAAALSYHLYEKPFLRRKERYALVKSREANA
jgi:peptidoglycan/LPS O-acetylase OafA/YrhL